MNISLSAFAPENLVSRDGFGSPVPRQTAHLHTQAESGAYLRDSSRLAKSGSRSIHYRFFLPCFLFGPCLLRRLHLTGGVRDSWAASGSGVYRVF